MNRALERHLASYGLLPFLVGFGELLQVEPRLEPSVHNAPTNCKKNMPLPKAGACKRNQFLLSQLAGGQWKRTTRSVDSQYKRTQSRRRRRAARPARPRRAIAPGAGTTEKLKLAAPPFGKDAPSPLMDKEPTKDPQAQPSLYESCMAT